jgi:hypothetical protein
MSRFYKDAILYWSLTEKALAGQIMKDPCDENFPKPSSTTLYLILTLQKHTQIGFLPYRVETPKQCLVLMCPLHKVNREVMSVHPYDSYP